MPLPSHLTLRILQVPQPDRDLGFPVRSQRRTALLPLGGSILDGALGLEASL